MLSTGGAYVKVTLLGHATVLVETGPMRILMDPVLQDPFENGMVVSCPKRVIDLDRLGDRVFGGLLGEGGRIEDLLRAVDRGTLGRSSRPGPADRGLALGPPGGPGFSSCGRFAPAC